MTSNKNKFILNQCEAVIEEGLSSFYKTLKALDIINSMKLYECNYSSIENYIEDKWDDKKELFSMIKKFEKNKIK